MAEVFLGVVDMDERENLRGFGELFERKQISFLFLEEREMMRVSVVC